MDNRPKRFLRVVFAAGTLALAGCGTSKSIPLPPSDAATDASGEHAATDAGNTTDASHDGGGGADAAVDSGPSGDAGDAGG